MTLFREEGIDDDTHQGGSVCKTDKAMHGVDLSR